jgi:hypothetical protein
MISLGKRSCAHCAVVWNNPSGETTSPNVVPSKSTRLLKPPDDVLRITTCDCANTASSAHVKNSHRLLGVLSPIPLPIVPDSVASAADREMLLRLNHETTNRCVALSAHAGPVAIPSHQPAALGQLLGRAQHLGNSTRTGAKAAFRWSMMRSSSASRCASNCAPAPAERSESRGRFQRPLPPACRERPCKLLPGPSRDHQWQPAQPGHAGPEPPRPGWLGD